MHKKHFPPRLPGLPGSPGLALPPLPHLSCSPTSPHSSLTLLQSHKHHLGLPVSQPRFIFLDRFPSVPLHLTPAPLLPSVGGGVMDLLAWLLKPQGASSSCSFQLKPYTPW